LIGLIIKWVESGVAWLLIGGLVVAGKREWSFLDSWLFQYLGKLSYGFYLFHFLILCVVSQYVLTNVSQVWLVSHVFLAHLVIGFGSVLLTIFIARVAYYLVERPGVAVGGWIIKRFG